METDCESSPEEQQGKQKKAQVQARDDNEQSIAANDGGFGLLAEMRAMHAKMTGLNDKIKKLESHRQSHLDLRQRAISTWGRDAICKDTERQTEETRRLNEDNIHNGDVRSDAMVVTGRYSKTSIEWQSFRILYGLTPDNVNDLDQQKCNGSLLALNRAASILLKDALTSLPNEAMGKKREDIVALLLEERYEEAEKMSSTFLVETSRLWLKSSPSVKYGFGNRDTR
ncbi:hypothetical protein N7510_011624 [Penicillium lagena]|uniref:uncharacterized protein n=1 Tax=Penicillium lagena TaxID=94218 RepID=UPI0025413F31|nr:uncharacterized protein N7510_011624 [Penicillium lagena]KAJ5602090.1 hypothetical protein N7510_011624 [Penicillium lagena]